MNYTIAIITFVLLTYLLYIQFKIWRLRALLSPATVFAGSWILGVLGMIILVPAGLAYAAFPNYINELNIFVGFTALCFIYFTKRGLNKVNIDSVSLQYSSVGVYNFLSILFIAGAVYDFIRLGANFNITSARDNVHEILSSQNVLIGYIKTLAMPLSLFAGNAIARKLLNQRRLSLTLFLPLLGNVIFSLNVGGRVDAFYSFLMYLMGFVLYLPLFFDISRYKKITVYLIIGIVMSVGFINFVGRQRQIGHYSEISIDEAYITDKSPLLGALYGPLSYSMASYTGYQARRNDAMPAKLGYGVYSFNGFINWTLPFSSLYGLGDFSIAKQLGVYYSNMETYDEAREFYYVTHSCYFLLMKDFGFWGSFLVIFILVYIAQSLFIKVNSRTSFFYATSFYLFYLFWQYWSKSIFGETLSRSVLVPLYGFLLIDILNYFTGQNKIQDE